MLIDIRDAFFEELYNKIKKDKRIILLSVDQGAHTIKKIIRDFPDNYINIGISEQNAFNVATGLAKRNYKPYVYLISPFTLRALEQIKIGLCSMNQKVCIVASGPGFTYASDGPTHYFNEDYGVLKNFPNLNFYCTSDSNSAKRAFLKSYQSKNPSFIRLEKGMYQKLGKYSLSSLNHLQKKTDCLVVSNGYLSVLINKIQQGLSKNLNFSMLDVSQLIPLDEKKIISIISKCLKEKIRLNSNTNNTDNWDSIGHLQILASLDKASKGKVSKINEIADVTSVEAIIKILRKKKLLK